MTGSALIDFFIGIIILAGVLALFFLTIDKIAPDPWTNRIGRIVVGVIALVALLVAIKTVFFGGGGLSVRLDGLALVYFGIGLLVLIAVVYVLQLLVSWIGFMPEPINYLIGIVGLIVLLALAGGVLFGGNLGSFGNLQPRRSEQDLPFMHRQVMIPPPRIQVLREE